tara:strand:+ start:79630 stop:80802 length:1173 start_codon:yes stop_codon:yes gene_type:complete
MDLTDIPEDTVVFSYRGQLEELLETKSLPKGFRKRLREGRLDLFNNPRLQVALRKDNLVRILAKHEVPIPLTVHNSRTYSHIYGPDHTGKYHSDSEIVRGDEPVRDEEVLSDLLCPRDNEFFMVKGISSHNAEQIGQMQKGSFPVAFIARNTLAQEFIYPPFEDGKIRELRFLIVNGDIVDVIPRQANLPVFDDGGDPVRIITSKYQLYAAWVLNEGLPKAFKDYYEAAKETALQAYKAVKVSYHDQKVGRVLRTPHDSFDWACVDIIFDRNGNPRVLEVDTNHDISNPLLINRDLRDEVFDVLSQYVGKRHLLIVEQKDDQPIGETTAGLLSLLMGSEEFYRVSKGATRSSQDLMFDLLRAELETRGVNSTQITYSSIPTRRDKYKLVS